MDFNKIGLAPDICGCLSFVPDSLDKYYARRIRKPAIDEVDFLTAYEKKDPQPAPPADINLFANWCDRVTALSINEWNETAKATIIKKMLRLFDRDKIKRKDAILVFRFDSDAGLIKHLADPHDPTHKNFYKSDTFHTTQITIVEIIELYEYTNK